MFKDYYIDLLTFIKEYIDKKELKKFMQNMLENSQKSILKYYLWWTKVGNT